MIVRQVLRDPTALDHFDWFNDGQDTARWLRAIRTADNAQRIDVLLKRLDEHLKPSTGGDTALDPNPGDADGTDLHR